jgi:serine/threonine protein kinase/formylglycine-generating enzyme required for sulfatase activity
LVDSLKQGASPGEERGDATQSGEEYRYTLAGPLSDGGQATVYAGRDERLGESVAMKLFRNAGDDDNAESRFMREVKILQKMQHRNIVGYRGVHELKNEWGDSRKFIIMDLMQGVTLKEYVANHRDGAPWSEASDILSQCLDGLIYAREEHGIIHRDLKPSNIFILDDGSVKLIDFGIARLDGSGTHTGGGGMMGSFDYMSPDFAATSEETFRGDEISDIYSLFACFYELLTGVLPAKKFGDLPELEYLTRWRDRPPKISYAHIIFRIVSGLGAFVARGLSVDRSKRFQTFREVGEHLRKLDYRVLANENRERYTLLEGLGQSGYAEVYKARQESSQRVVAVKCMSAAADKQYIRDLLALQRYVHPCMVRYLDLFEARDEEGRNALYLVMEFLEGKTLRDALRTSEAGLPVRGVLMLFLRYLAALDAMHHGRDVVVHRAIRPSNLFGSPEAPNEAKLLDIGATMRLDTRQMARGNAVVCYHLAPEIISGAAVESSASDVYALGLCLFEALTGSTAYPKLPENETAAIQAIRSHPVRDINAVPFLHPCFDRYPELVGIIEKAIEPDRAKRYAQARDMWNSIAAAAILHHPEMLQDVEDMQAQCLVVREVHGDKKRFLSVDPPRSRSLSDFTVWRQQRHRFFVLILLSMLIGATALAVQQYYRPFQEWRRERARVGFQAEQDASAPAVEALSGDPSPELLADPNAVPKDRQEAREGSVEPLADVEAVRPILPTFPEPAHPSTEEVARDEMERCLRDLESSIRRITVRGAMRQSYDGLMADLRAMIGQYEQLVHDPHYHRCAQTPEILAVVRRFWFDMARSVVQRASNADADNLLSMARGLLHHGLLVDEQLLPGSPLEERIDRMYAIVQALLGENNQNIMAKDYLPARPSRKFRFISDDPAEYTKSNLNASLGEHRAALLPGKGVLDIEAAVTRGTVRTTIASRLDFVLVPDGQATVEHSDGVSRTLRIPHPFYMMTHEVGMEAIRCYVYEAPAHYARISEHKIRNVRDDNLDKPYPSATVDEAIDFCNWLSLYDGLAPLYSRRQDGSIEVNTQAYGYRLPTAEEWEYAARMGFDFKREQGRSPWDEMNRSGLRHNSLLHFYWKTEPRLAARTGESERYPLGLFDMCGNVAEICMELPRAESADTRTVSTVSFVLKGGRIDDAEENILPWSKRPIEENWTGFRVIKVVPIEKFY